MILGVETGGTSIRVASAEHPAEPLRLEVLPTERPSRALPVLMQCIDDIAAGARIDAVGIAAFGPLDVDPDSSTYGTIGSTPKEDWVGLDLRSTVAEVVGAPVAIDTDVTAAAIAERRWGAAAGLSHVAYVTVGTGVGVGAIVDGRPLHGAAHPELGHLTVRRHPDDRFAGVCRFHSDCLEGLTSAPALAARWGRAPERLAGDETIAARAVDVASYYLAQLMLALTYTLSPQAIVLAGGVLSLRGLREATRAQTSRLLAGALGDHPASSTTSSYIRGPGLGARSGVIGALTLADDLRSEGRVSSRP